MSCSLQPQLLRQGLEVQSAAAVARIRFKRPVMARACVLRYTTLLLGCGVLYLASTWDGCDPPALPLSLTPMDSQSGSG